MNENGPQTLIEAVKHFADLGECHAYMVNLKWPDGKIVLPEMRWRQDRQHHQPLHAAMQSEGMPQANSAPRSARSSRTRPFRCLRGSSRSGASPTPRRDQQLRTRPRSRRAPAYRVVHAASHPPCHGRNATGRKFHDVVESDETYIGGKAANMHFKRRGAHNPRRGGVGKTIVHGCCSAIAKTDQARSALASSRTRSKLRSWGESSTMSNRGPWSTAIARWRPAIREQIHSPHDRHSMRYVAGKVHINGIENFWCLVSG